MKRFQLLPETLQEAIFSQRGIDAVLKNCMLRDVPADKIPLIDQLTGRVLLGYLRPETFAFEIQKETGIDSLKATQVAHDIDTEIFSEVRLELKKLYPPTIQTPTVQAPGFLKPETRNVKPEIQDSSFKIQEQKPRYVVPIPERFKRASPWPQQPTTDNSQLITNNKEVAPQEPKKSPANEAREATEAGVQAPQPPKIQVPRFKIQEPASPPMDPIVPLPTFIQSKFTNATSPETHNLKPDAQDSSSKIQDSSKTDALKKAFGKFTAPSTATGVVKEPVSPYRETIEEPTKPGEQKPTPKIQGKVIDLSQF